MVSVCVATYNGEKYLKEQLDSILKQLIESDEVIISDDGSKDSTLDVIKSFNDPRIKIYINKGEHGYTANFENALKYSSGDIIVLSDQDDVWSADKISTIKTQLEWYDFLVSDATVVNEKLEVLSKSFWSLRKPHYNAFGDFIQCSYLGCCMAFKRDVLLMALPFPKNHNLCCHDYWLQLIGSFYFSVRYEHKPLVYYRRHGGNVSDAGLSKGAPLVHKIKYRMYTLFWLIIRRINYKKE